MPSGRYFLGLTGAVLLGLVTLILAAAAVILALPYIIPFFAAMLPFLVGAALVVVAIIIIWLVLYAAAYIGVAIYYAIRHPMEVNRDIGSYDLEKVKESGKREKGESESREKEEEE